MNAVVPFAFEDKLVRAVWRESDPWFVAADVCRALGLTDTSKTVSALDADEKGTSLTRTPSGDQEMLIISEGGLFSIILRCRDAMKPGTVPHRFRRWVTGEVLPALRRAGRYAMPGAEIEGQHDSRSGSYLDAGRSEAQLDRNMRMVQEMRLMKGPVWAFALYRKLGLPVAEPEPEDIAQAQAVEATAKERTVAADTPVADALTVFLKPRTAWTGTSVQLLAFLNAAASETERRRQGWPRTPRALSNAIERTRKGILAEHRITVERGRRRDLRTITLRLAPADAEPAP